VRCAWEDFAESPACLDEAVTVERTEVTVEAYGRCVDARACTTKGLDNRNFCNWPMRRERADHPINCVTFEQARAYCAWRGMRLPTGAEWELAARDVDGRSFSWGNDPSGPAEGAPLASAEKRVALRLGRALNLGICWRHTGTCPAASGPENGFGLVGMAGNVAEWTGDRATDDPRLRMGIEPDMRSRDWRVYYGTAWSDPFLDEAYLLALPKARIRWTGDQGIPSVGVRCARGRLEHGPVAADEIHASFGA
jgi:formylglycine-generating enzyme required for sulfatase activity